MTYEKGLNASNIGIVKETITLYQNVKCVSEPNSYLFGAR